MEQRTCLEGCRLGQQLCLETVKIESEPFCSFVIIIAI